MKRIGVLHENFGENFHWGYIETILQALCNFDLIIIANKSDDPAQNEYDSNILSMLEEGLNEAAKERILYMKFNGSTASLVDFIPENKEVQSMFTEDEYSYDAYPVAVTGIIKRLDHATQVGLEISKAAWLQVVGLKIPIVYFMCSNQTAYLNDYTVWEMKQSGYELEVEKLGDNNEQ